MMRYGSEAKIMSALSVVTPLATACSEYSPPSASSINDSERAMCVDERCTIVTSAPFSQRSAQMSCAELFEPITTADLPRQASPPGCLLEWCCSPVKVSAPLMAGTLALPDMPVASTRCLGRSVTGLPLRSTVTTHSWAASS